MEINRAEGGYKNVVTTGRLVPVVVNTYGRLTYYQTSGSEFQPEFQRESDNYTTHDQILNVTNELNDSSEFTENRKRSEEYKVTNVCLTIDYNRVPQAGDRVSKLLLMTGTDKVNITASSEMKKENNVMMLSMSSTGIKNYNTRVTIQTTSPENLTWQSSSYTWAGVWKIRVNQQDITTLTRLNDEMYITLATWKLSIRVLFRITDVENLNLQMNNAPRLNTLVTELEGLRKRIEELEQEKAVLLDSEIKEDEKEF